MSTVYRPVPTPVKWQEIEETLTGYWEKDRWDIIDPIFDEFRSERWFLQHRAKIIDFSCLQSGIREEVKFFLPTVFRNIRCGYARRSIMEVV